MRDRSRPGDARRGGSLPDGPGRLEPGERVTIVHAKPWKRTITMRGTIASWDGERLTVERQFSGGGQYDSLFVPKLAGDWGTIEVARGSRVLRRAYFRQNGTPIGELFNIQTPAEIDERGVRYIDLEIDVVRRADGHVEVVDEADLDAAVRVGGIRPEEADRARVLAYHLAETLQAGGDWHEAERVT